MADSSYHYVQASSLLKSIDLLKLFFMYLSTKTSAESVKATLNEFQPYLEIKRSNEMVEIPHQQNLKEAGIQQGEVCQIRGKPKKVNV